ncbi:MAG: cyclodeaminase/cyclohydrolase family protein [Candidatus Thermoplasmatota archaeon]|nr:cyclodeaminase/cyclohydrolase family protein [Candidatus Thermoplasmatota archaeon]
MSHMDEFIEKVASDSPTPGGGSVSALASSLGCALNEMVSRISLKKESDQGVTGELQTALNGSGELRTRLASLVDEDAQAYQAVMDSYSLPKGTEEEREKRTTAIQDALVGAAEPPLRIMRASLEVLDMAKFLAESGSKNACTDAGVAALMAQAGLHGGYLNVRINLAYVRNKDIVENMENEARSAFEKGSELLESILAIVNSRLSLQ